MLTESRHCDWSWIVSLIRNGCQVMSGQVTCQAFRLHRDDSHPGSSTQDGHQITQNSRHTMFHYISQNFWVNILISHLIFLCCDWLQVMRTVGWRGWHILVLLHPDWATNCSQFPINSERGKILRLLQHYVSMLSTQTSQHTFTSQGIWLERIFWNVRPKWVGGPLHYVLPNNDYWCSLPQNKGSIF